MNKQSTNVDQTISKQSVLKNNQGVALVTVILILMVFMILFGGSVYISTRNVSSSVQSKNYNNVYYTAESGINVMVEQIIEGYKNIEISSDLNGYKSTAETYINAQIASLPDIEVIDADANHYRFNLSNTYTDIFVESVVTNTAEKKAITYTFTSTGHNHGLSRTLTSGVEILMEEGDESTTPFFDMETAILVTGSLDLTGVKVNAPVVTTGKSVDYGDKPIKITGYTSGMFPNIYVPKPKLNDEGIPEHDILEFNVNACKANPITYVKKYIDSIPDWMINQADVCTKLAQSPYDDYTPTATMPVAPETSILLPKAQVKNKSNTMVDIVDSSGNFLQPTGNHTYNLSEGSNELFYAKSVTFNKTVDNTMTINVGNKDVQIVTDKLTLRGNLKIEGSGSLTFYVGKSNTSNTLLFENGNSLTIGNAGDSNKLIVYSYGTNTTAIGGSTTYHMALMAENLSLNLTGSGGVKGAVVSTGPGTISVDGGAHFTGIFIYAPEAKFKMGSGTVNGAIVAKDFESTSWGTINFDNSGFQDIPFDITSPVVDENSSTGSTPSTFSIKQGPVIED